MSISSGRPAIFTQALLPMSEPASPRVRVVVITVLIAAAFSLISACGNQSPSHSRISNQQYVHISSTIGSFSIKSNGSEVISLSGRKPGTVDSRRFYVVPRADVSYIWLCANLEADSTFHASLLSNFASGSVLDELMHVGARGLDGPLGSRSWTNDGKLVNGRRVFPVACSVRVTASASSWSLLLLVGTHSQLTFSSPILGFSLRYNPAVCGFNEVHFDSRMAKALRVETGSGVSVVGPRANYGASLIDMKDYSGPSRKLMRAVTLDWPGRHEAIHSVHIGYAAGFRQVVTQGAARTVFMVLSRKHRSYLLVGFYTTRFPKAQIGFSRLVGTLDFET